MATLTTIRRLQVQMESQGADKLASDLRKVADGQEAVATATEKSAKGNLSAESSLEKLRRSYDRDFRENQRMASAMRDLDRVRMQGLVSMTEQARLADLIRQRHTVSTMALNDNVQAYGRLNMALAQMSPLMAQFGMGRSVGFIGGGAFAGVAAGIAAVAGASTAIARAGDEWTGYANRLRAAGEASGTVAARQKELVDIAMRSRSSLEGVVDLYATTGRATQELGVSQQQVARVVETVTKSFTLNGGSAASAAGAIVQLGQAFNSGTLRGEEFNSVMEQAPGIARLIAKEFGVGMGELRKFAEDGKLSADRVFQAIANGSAEVDKEFAKTTSTMRQGATNAGTALTELGAEMDRIFGISERLARAFQGVADAARGMAGSISAWGDEREVDRIKSTLEAISVYERQVQELQGRRDYASQKDLAAATEQLTKYRKEWEALTTKRINDMVQLPAPITLNSEGLVTTERAMRDLTKATDTLAEAERKFATDSMTPLQKATEEANKAHADRLKLFEQARQAGVEQVKINQMIADSEKLRIQAVAAATEEAQKRMSTRSRRDPSMRGLNSDFADSLSRMMQEIPGITINSGFRSIERQAELWEQALRKYGSAAEARKWVAPPGRSQHGRGFAADLGFANDAARQEAHRRAGEFGLSFPLGNEPWHIESKGARLEQEIKQQDDWRQAIDEAGRSLDMQSAMVGKSASEIARLHMVQELQNEALRAGITITPQMAQQIEALGQRAADAAMDAETLRDRMQMMETFNDLGRDALKGFISDLRAGKSGAEALANALERVADRLLDIALDSLFSNGKSGGGLLSGIINAFTGSPATAAAVHHMGGMVGIDGTTRYVHPAYFENAPRFHNGTLAHDERAAILQTGEVVLSRDDVATGRAIGASMGQQQVIQPVVNVIGARQQPKVEIGPDGSIDLIFDRVEGHMADKARKGRGPLYKSTMAHANNRTLRG